MVFSSSLLSRFSSWSSVPLLGRKRLLTDIVGTPPPPSPALLKGGQDLPKNESLVGVPKTLLERGENPQNGVDVEMGGLPLFLLLYSSIAFTVCGGVCWVS